MYYRIKRDDGLYYGLELDYEDRVREWPHWSHLFGGPRVALPFGTRASAMTHVRVMQAQGYTVRLVKVTVRPKARQTEPCPVCPECGSAYGACWRCG